MKKFYTLSVTILAFVFFNSAFGQYTATKTGNWSNTVTWAPGVKPSANCNNCTITINSGVIVTLDAAVTLTGTSQLIINSNAELIIPASSTSQLAAHNSITLVFATPGPTIKLVSSTSVVKVSAGSTFDGIFNSFAGGIVKDKLIGTGQSVFVFGAPTTSPAPPLGATLAGPITLNSSGTLPVVLVNFDAVLADGSVDLSWTTEVEINSDHFNVQRSADGTNWQTIGTVAAGGNTTVEVNYSFTDQSPLASVNYYRLQSVDKDDKYTYSDIKVVRGSLIQGFSVFPNPAKDYVNVTLSSTATSNLVLRLIDQNGKVLQTKQVSNAAGTTISFAVHNYPEGAYLLQIKGADGTQQTSKLLITRQ